MTILMFGDIMGKPGRQAIAKILPELRKKYDPDLVMANAENLAHGYGITKKTVDHILGIGIDVLTSGNHIFDKKEALELLANKNYPILRPANYPSGVAGRGYQVFEVRTKKVLVINLIGRVFFQYDYDCPFRCADEILKKYKEEKIDATIIDFHAEATSENVALGYYLDGKVSAVLGTHSHVPTCDFKILPKGTAYVSDIGMVGAVNSIIGDKKESVIKRFLYQISTKLEIEEEGPVEVNAVALEIDNLGKAKRIEKIGQVVDI